MWINLLINLLISAPSLGVSYCQQLTLSVCLSVCLSVTLLQIASSFFVSRWNRAIFWPSFLHVPLYKTFFFHFSFRPPNAQNLLPKICTKSPVSRLVWQIDRRCLGLPGGFRGCPIQWNHAKCCGPTLVAMATKFGLGAQIQSLTGFTIIVSLSFMLWLWVPLVSWRCYSISRHLIVSYVVSYHAFNVGCGVWSGQTCR